MLIKKNFKALLLIAVLYFKIVEEIDANFFGVIPTY